MSKGLTGRRAESAAVLFLLAGGTGALAQSPSAPAEQPKDAAALQPPPASVSIQPETRGTRMMDEVLITATASEQSKFNTPYTVETVSRQQIRERQYRTTPEALREIPGIMVQKTSYSQGSPFIRGFTGFRTLFLIDGIRLNNSTFREGPNQYWGTVDPFLIGRLEVVKGASSVLYGSDAIGGTVNAITESPTTYGEGFNFGAEATYRYATADNSHVGRIEGSATHDERFGVKVGFTARDFDDVRTGGGEQPNTSYEEYAFDVKGEYHINPDLRLVIAHNQGRQNDAPRTHATNQAKSFEGTAIGTDRRRDLDQERALTYVQMHADSVDAFFDKAFASVSYHHQKEAEDRIRSNGARSISEYDVGTIGLLGQLQSPTPIGRFTYGFEYYRDMVTSSSTANAIQGQVADDASYDLFGLYVQDVIPFADVFEATLGGRFTYVALNADRVSNPLAPATAISISDEWSALTGNARLVYKAIPDTLNIFAGFSQGFRAPNLSDVSRLDIARSGEREIASTDLDPENYYQFEIGAKAQQENWAAEAAVFYTLIDNQIIRQPTGNIVAGAREVRKRNGGDGFIYGVEAGASWRFHPQFTVFGNATWMDGEIDQFPTSAPVKATEPVSRLMPLTGQIGVRWDHAEKKFWAEAAFLAVADADQLNSADRLDTQRIPPGGTPGYNVLSLRGGWRICPNAELTLAVENVFDEDYRTHGSGTNEPGINAIASVTIRY